MGLLENYKNEVAHSRNLTISTFGCDKGGIIVEGELVDNRLRSGFSPAGEKRPPKTIHHIKIREIEAKMPGIPNKECAETCKSLDRIKGMSIVTGFTMKVKDILGGINGCAQFSGAFSSDGACRRSRILGALFKKTHG